MNRLKELRMERGYSQQEFATLFNVAQGTISNYEKGRRLIDATTIAEMSKFFNVSADYFMGLSDVRDNENSPTVKDDGARAEIIQRVRALSDSDFLRLEAWLAGFQAGKDSRSDTPAPAHPDQESSE